MLTPQQISETHQQIDIELQRLGWDIKKTSEFLFKTYGKRARLLLNDEQLVDFLNKLKHEIPF